MTRLIKSKKVLLAAGGCAMLAFALLAPSCGGSSGTTEGTGGSTGTGGESTGTGGTTTTGTGGTNTTGTADEDDGNRRDEYDRNRWDDHDGNRRDEYDRNRWDDHGGNRRRDGRGWRLRLREHAHVRGHRRYLQRGLHDGRRDRNPDLYLRGTRRRWRSRRRRGRRARLHLRGRLHGDHRRSRGQRRRGCRWWCLCGRRRLHGRGDV